MSTSVLVKCPHRTETLATPRENTITLMTTNMSTNPRRGSTDAGCSHAAKDIIKNPAILTEHSSNASPAVAQRGVAMGIKTCSSTKPAKSRQVSVFGSLPSEGVTAHKTLLKQLPSDGIYATDSTVRNLLSRRAGRYCKGCTIQQKNICGANISSTNTAESTGSKRTSCVAHRMSTRFTVLAILFIILATYCDASPISSKHRSAKFSSNSTSHLTNGTRRTHSSRRVSKRGIENLISHRNPKKLYNNKMGVYLAVNKKGRVIATKDGNDPNTHLKFDSPRNGYVSIKFRSNNRYLGMKPRKKALYASKHYTDECCLFKEEYDADQKYFTYMGPASTKTKKKKRKRSKPRYVAVFKNGKAKRYHKRHKSIFFTHMPV